jgi:AcrR family transcriptional regulator
MPRIQAATVKEHRAAQRQHLLEAAREILAESGQACLTFGELAERAGLGRSSIYDYFSTRDELLVALMDEAFDAWYEQLARALSRVTAAEDKVEAFLLVHLRMVKRGGHGMQALFGQMELSADAQRHVGERHRQILGLLEPAMVELAPGDVELGFELLRGVLKSAMDRVTAGKSPRGVAHRVAAFLVAGFRALRRID